jgi:uncharacterized protein YndB with AHSA1/START domain
MTEQTILEPVRTEIRVAAPPQRAFDAFTAEFEAWWPRDSHHIADQPAAELIIEPARDGRWFERAADGTECEWGRVLAWEPPGRLVLAWQLDADWRYDPDLVTEVELRFVPDGDGTRVELEHRNLERLGARAAEVRAAVSSDGGWPILLQRFADHVEA